MFRTRMALDITRSATQQALTSPEIMNEAVRSAHYGENALWRIDQLRDRPYLLVLSRFRPAMWGIHEQLGIPGAFPSWESECLDDALEALARGDRLRFRLLAMPPEDAPPARLKDWLISEGAVCGFSLSAADFDVLHVQRRALPAATVTAAFAGVLTVLEPERFASALQSGIGGGRRFGMGLMTLDAPGAHQRT